MGKDTTGKGASDSTIIGTYCIELDGANISKTIALRADVTRSLSCNPLVSDI
jgi:hypothetical protein